MSNDHGNNNDHNLLARLNALKKSSIDLKNKQYTVPAVTSHQIIVNPSPARALHADLLSRFNTLKGRALEPSSTYGIDQVSGVLPDDGKTVEELLADLGPPQEWELHKTEEDQIEDLLRVANDALTQAPTDIGGQGTEPFNERNTPSALPDIDVSVFQPEPESDGDHDSSESETDKQKRSVEDEANEVLDRLLDEAQHESVKDASSSVVTKDDLPARPLATDAFNLELPSTPSQDPKSAPASSADVDADLSSRFASLSLPSVPSTMKSATTTASKPGFTDEEIESWCIICNDDATLQCIGCDGDLYCTNCWVEGHRGEDAGYEERKHKAVQYNKGGGAKKQKVARRRVGVSA